MTNGPCAKQTVTATVVDVTGRYFFKSTNYCYNPQQTCPRAGMKTGEGYELCHNICRQPNHAEKNALILAGDKARGGTLYVEGHTYACDSCVSAAEKAGIVNIVFSKPPTTDGN